MFESILQFAERMFVGPIWPASLMVGIMLAYALVVCLGFLDLGLDVPDLGADADLDLDLEANLDTGADLPDLAGGGLWSLGGMSIRWMNLNKIPVVFWLSLFTSFFWAISYGLWYGHDSVRYAPTIPTSILLTMRNGVLGILATKLITDRLGFLSKPSPTFEAARLIGKTCEVATSEVSPVFGQAKFKTDAAPLLLNIRTDQASLPQGTTVRIVDFDPKRRLYTVVAEDLSENT